MEAYPVTGSVATAAAALLEGSIFQEVFTGQTALEGKNGRCFYMIPRML